MGDRLIDRVMGDKQTGEEVKTAENKTAETTTAETNESEPSSGGKDTSAYERVREGAITLLSSPFALPVKMCNKLVFVSSSNFRSWCLVSAGIGILLMVAELMCEWLGLYTICKWYELAVVCSLFALLYVFGYVSTNITDIFRMGSTSTVNRKLDITFDSINNTIEEGVLSGNELLRSEETRIKEDVLKVHNRQGRNSDTPDLGEPDDICVVDEGDLPQALQNRQTPERVLVQNGEEDLVARELPGVENARTDFRNTLSRSDVSVADVTATDIYKSLSANGNGTDMYTKEGGLNSQFFGGNKPSGMNRRVGAKK